MSTQHFTFYADIDDHAVRFIMRDIDNAITKGASKIHISMSSRGGSTKAGFTIYNFLKGVSVELSTHNLGHVDSASLCMFLAGENRTASPISSFNIHKPTSNLPNESAYSKHLLFEYARGLEYDENNLVSIYTERASMDERTVRNLLDQGTVLTPSEALKFGIISSIEMFTKPIGEPVPCIGM
ncbi:MAG: ATP-dependent Clp protease proteolytic subunit [Candidatus Competibacteraceae bacterium]